MHSAKIHKIGTKTNIVHNLIESNIQNIYIKNRRQNYLNVYTEKVTAKEGINVLNGS